MSTINTNDLRVQNATFLVSHIQNESNYMFISKPTEWESGDDTPPVPTSSYKEFYSLYDQMISAKKVQPNEVYHMIPRINWRSGVIYDMYRHDYGREVRAFSGAANLYDALYIVVNQNFDVYVCLFNNDNQASTVEPQNISGEAFYTSDGYQWLKLYSLTADQRTNYITNNYIPVVVNELANGDAGAINTIVIETPGDGYTNNPAGISNQLPYYYCNIDGDGSDGVARVKVENGQIKLIEVVVNGSGYTYGALDFAAGRVYKSLGDLQNGVNGLNPIGDGTFESTVIISPPGGWGTDVVRETGGTRVGVFSSLLFDENDFFEDITFRQIGIMSQPSFTNGSPDTATGCFAIKVDDIGGVDTFTIGETISQTVTVNGVPHAAKGQVVSYDVENGILRYFQDPSLHSDTDGNLYEFAGTRFVTGAISEKIVQPDIEYTGELGNTTFFNGYAGPEMVKYTGRCLYLSNVPPVLRQNTQTERVSLIIGY